MSVDGKDKFITMLYSMNKIKSDNTVETLKQENF